MTVVAKAHGPLSQSELADRLGVEGATMVAMVDRLAKAGLVVRQQSEADRRINHVVITEAGRQLWDAVRIEAAVVCRELLADIDPGQLALATELLETLRGLIERCP